MGSIPRAPEVPGVELTGVIGSGGSGVVYLGHQRAFGRDVAVKVAARNAADDAVRRWEREVAAVGRLSNHPNIVPVFDAGITPDGAPYLVMPFVPGGSLSDRLREEGPMSPDRVAVVGAKLAGALSVVHGAGVLHRDVKPDNVLWSPHGEPQLTDFGIARLQDLTATTSGAVHATIAYAAPEVLAGEPATEASDLYGLGATLHACLTGSSPYPTDGDNLGALVARVLEQPPAPLAGAAPPALASVIERAMSRDPADRHPSMAALREALEEVDTAAAAAAPAPTVAQTVFLTTPPSPTETAPQPVVAPAPARPADVPPVDRPAPVRAADPAGPPSRSHALWFAVALVLLLFVGLVAYGLAQDDDGDGTTAGPSSTTVPVDDTAAPADQTTAPETTEEAEESEETTTTAAPADESSDDGSTGADAMAEEALAYFGLLQDGALDDAWSSTTNRFQNSQDREAWEAFWGGFDQIDVVGDPAPDPDSGTVVVPLTLDGQREDYTLEMSRQGGEWRVDGPVGNPTGGG